MAHAFDTLLVKNNIGVKNYTLAMGGCREVALGAS